MDDFQDLMRPPWKKISVKQKDLMRLCRQKSGHKKLIGVFGTRVSGKTMGAMKCICDHLWTVKDARFLILTRTQGSGATSGVWNELTERELPAWMSAKGISPEDDSISMAWAHKGEPRLTPAKKYIATVTNMHGGTSRLELDSLDDEREVEDKFKSRYYTGIYWSEAGEFKDPKTLTTLFLALRSPGHSADDFLMLVDANPPDEGQDHFLYKFFYELRISREVEETDPEKAKALQAIKECLHVTEWTMDDNPFLSENEKDAIKGAYANDPDLYDRYVRGMWKKAIRNALFADAFKTSLHVAGGFEQGEEILLLPTEGCISLMTSHDAGGVNPVSYIVEEYRLVHQMKLYDGTVEEREIPHFQYLDELAFIGGDISPAEFTKLMLEKMDFWEQEIGQEVTWTHYADLAALNQKESIAQRTVADEMYIESEGRIRLIGVEKGAGSIALRIRLWRRMLMEQRVLISKTRCPKLIEMCQCIKRGLAEGTISKQSPHKHPFDAATYVLVKRCWSELQKERQKVRARTRVVSSEPVVISM